jgi:hypothetical protein
MANGDAYSATILGSHVSDVLTAAGITACFALLGIAIANLVTLWLAKRQREFEMRRAVYLEAAVAIATGQTMIGSALDLSVTSERIRNGIEGAAGALAKINVTGKIRTIEAVGAYSKKLAEAAQRLWLGRTFLQGLETRIADLNAQRQSSEAELQRLSNFLQSIPRGTASTLSTYDNEVAKSTYQSMQGHERKIAVLSADREALLNMKLAQVRQWSDEALTFLRDLQALIPAVLVAARKEMHMKVNADKISAIFEDLAAHGDRTARNTIASVEGVFAPLLPKGAGGRPLSPESTEAGGDDASGG